MNDAIHVVRHTAVARHWHGRCYGRSDAGLSREGVAGLAPLAATLAALDPLWVIHSNTSRTHRLAARVARLARCPLLVDAGWQERDFGSWEGHRWNAIYRASGSAMDGMIDEPDSFRPGGGETTSEMAQRCSAAWQRLPVGHGIVVSHGGPIAALLGVRQGLPPRAWLSLIPPLGSTTKLAR